MTMMPNCSHSSSAAVSQSQRGAETRTATQGVSSNTGSATATAAHNTTNAVVDFQRIAVPALRSTHEQMRSCISVDLLPACQREVNFLRMIDRKAPVLYEQRVVTNAIRRYETCWLPAQAAKPDLNNIPPLDVHWVWHVHMLSPVHYRDDCMAICGTVVDHKLLSADEIQQRYEQSVSAWNDFCPEEPYDFLLSTTKPYQQRSTYDIADAVQRQRNFNYQISLPHFTAPRFLADAIHRYINFLQLKQTYPDQFLTPCYDFDIVWHTHQVHPHDYHRDCVAIFGQLLKHDDSVNDRNKGSKLLRGEALTKKAWAAHFKESFWRRGCMYRGHVAPVFLGFEQEDTAVITYGHVHIPSIALREIPVQREQLRLKLSYGGKKITTFNADLWDKQVTRSSFSLVWQPHSDVEPASSSLQNGSSRSAIATASTSKSTAGTVPANSSTANLPSTSSSSTSSPSSLPTSIVKFPFDRKCPKELLVELVLYDKVFLHKRDVCRLRGRLSLEQLLPISQQMKPAQQNNLIQLQLDGANGERARMSMTTSISLNREFDLLAGDYIEQQLQPNSRLWTLCHAAALNRAQLQPGVQVFVATHTLVDVRDGKKYFAQIVHSAPLLLSMILVFGMEQRVLCMAHLIGADQLPTKEQLDSNLQFLPNICSNEERAFLVLNKDGDFAILKGRWHGFVRRLTGDKKQTERCGAPGVLNVELFNLIRNTVQKFQLPAANGSTIFTIGDAQGRLNGRRMHCRSTLVAEHLACIFGIGTLFILCNPDKVRSHREPITPVGHQCQKWPMTLACGYGRPVPSNRLLSSISRCPQQQGYTGMELAPVFTMICAATSSGGGGAAEASACDGVVTCGTVPIWIHTFNNYWVELFDGLLHAKRQTKKNKMELQVLAELAALVVHVEVAAVAEAVADAVVAGDTESIQWIYWHAFSMPIM